MKAAAQGNASSDMPQAEIPSGGKRYDPHGPSFWKPKCKAHLWSDNCDLFDDLMSDDDDGSSTGSDSEADAAWAFLNAHAGHAKPQTHIPSSGGNSCASGSSRAQSCDGRTSSTTAGRNSAPPGAMPRQSGCAYSKPPPVPRPPQEDANNTQGDAHNSAPHGRGHAAGFQFGGKTPSSSASAPAGSMSAPPGVGDGGPEAQVSAILRAAQANGPSAVKKALKKLLLKWHPDKVMQGTSAEAVHAQAEATRVLRFILQERERLGI